MAVKKNLPINVCIVQDSREKDTYYIKDMLEQRRGKDGIKFTDVKVEAVKPLGCKTSTGDLTFEFQFDGEEEWQKTKFVVEIKKSLDLTSSITNKANFDRLCRELERGKEANLDFYFISTSDVETINKELSKVPRFRNTNMDTVGFEKYIDLQNKLTELGFCGVIVSGRQGLAWVLRRLIKIHIKKFKLQQKKNVDSK